ncbi:COX15/CtaA family protein [Limibacter armeniacum]|uniref:COX15/CtaA family protein n=1 Tax=Limibacter armeniacum TaxID=466084 RepID=UPI002FE66EA1
MKISQNNSQGHWFRKFGVITIAAVFFLVLVGGIVRSTGAGLGCPDWPKCFGQWVPPTDVSQLPEDYKTIYAIQGKQIADFSAVHTWIEYVNRLVGVVIGFLILTTLILSKSYWKTDRVVVWLSFLAFILVGFNGWLGSVVVATNLKPVTITLHMIMALMVVGTLIFAVARSYKGVLDIPAFSDKKKLNLWLGICVGLSLLQLVFGTQVREAIDHIAASYGGETRQLWVGEVGLYFYIHRTFSIIVLLGNVYLAKLFFSSVKGSQKVKMQMWSYVLVGLLGMEIMTGVIMAYFAIPAFLQPVHLLLSSLLFGLQFYMVLLVNYESVVKQNVESERKAAKLHS